MEFFAKIKNKFPSLIIALLICLSFFLLALFSTAGFQWNDLKHSGSSITCDEFAHIPAGYYYLKTSRYFFNLEHPPLIKDIAALPLLIINPTLPRFSEIKHNFEYPYTEAATFARSAEIQNDEWSWGYLFLFYPGNNLDQMVFWSRLAMIIFNSILLFLLYYFLSKIWSVRAAFISIFFIALTQFTLAHGSLVTMDFASTLLQIITLVWFSAFLKKFIENKKYSVSFFFTIIFLTLAILTKFSSLVLLPVIFIGAIVYLVIVKKSARWLSPLSMLVLLILSSIILAVAFYSLHLFGAKGDEIFRQIQYLYPKNFSPVGLDILNYLSRGNIFLKGLAEFIMGILLVFFRIEGADQVVYFLGRNYGAEGAGFWYFPLLYLTKISVPLLFLTFMMLIIKVVKIFQSKIAWDKELRKSVIQNAFAWVLIVFIFTYLPLALFSRLNIGLRHIMPVVISSFLLTAKALDSYWEMKIYHMAKIKHIFFASAALIIFSTIYTFPNYLSYYNFLVGGYQNGYNIATDSNHDWGQDVKRLANWAEENKVKTIYANIFTKVPLAYYLEEKYQPLYLNSGDIPPSGSYLAISTFRYQDNVYDESLLSSENYAQFKKDFIGIVGGSILVFRVP